MRSFLVMGFFFDFTASWTLSSSLSRRFTQSPARAEVQMIDPITLSASAFLAGALPPSLLVINKDQQLQQAKAELSSAKAELSDLRDGFTSALIALEIQANASEVSLNELLNLSVRKARRYKDEMQSLQQDYETQLSQLRDMVGDYTDKLELQQNAFKRNELVTESARAETQGDRGSLCCTGCPRGARSPVDLHKRTRTCQGFGCGDPTLHAARTA